MSGEQTKEMVQLRVVYLFDVEDESGKGLKDINGLIGEMPKAASFLPKYWAVDEQDREFLRQVHSDPFLFGTGIVIFKSDMELSEEESTRLQQLLADVVEHKADKYWLLDSDTVRCVAGFSGTRDNVLAEIQNFVRQQDEMAADSDDAPGPTGRTHGPKPSH